jgi:CubicO group peptidase (beta-lactamase class C family)
MQIYNNSGVWLLGLVIEKASGQSYEDYIEKEIFEPLGMERSMYCKSEENIARRAHGYFVLPPRKETSRAFPLVHTWAFAAGALCSSAGDLVTWIRALHGGGVLSPESYAELITPATLNDGTPLRYSMGMQVGPDANGLHYIGHGGAGPGFRAEVGWYPEGQLAVVVLINTAGPIDAGEVASELAREVLPWTPREPLRFVGDPAPLVGWYVGPGREPGEIIEIEVTETPEGVAFSPNGSPPQAFPWVEGLTFGSGQMRLIFRRANGDNGPVTELRRSMPGAHFIFKKIYKKQ